MMKTITIILTLPILLFSLSNCGGAQNTNTKKSLVQNPPFKITEAYFQEWVAGVQDGGSGTDVHIVFKDMAPKVEIQNIYFRNQIKAAKEKNKQPNRYVANFENEGKPDTIMDADPIKEAQNTPEKAFPFQLKDNQAVVEYRFKGEINYYKISELSEKRMIPYPQANPNIHE
ncbi:hypothetical protein [Aequorivita marina]|uniref:hypothetical protein n=1 Tax=Aequorivita marina TaxID=3073654 RepID=UPI002875E286|nr:hypothetical protein [Aequorivita sp. S2608]MDS1299011.1 hypothetical protein [Aequorivita sp. S2608]